MSDKSWPERIEFIMEVLSERYSNNVEADVPVEMIEMDAVDMVIHCFSQGWVERTPDGFKWNDLEHCPEVRDLVELTAIELGGLLGVSENVSQGLA